MDLSKFVSFERSGKAIASGGCTLVGGAVSKIVLVIVGYHWPWFVAAGAGDSVDVVCVALIAYVAAYVPANPKA